MFEVNDIESSEISGPVREISFKRSKFVFVNVAEQTVKISIEFGQGVGGMFSYISPAPTTPGRKIELLHD